jgi:hypothetical protein
LLEVTDNHKDAWDYSFMILVTVRVVLSDCKEIKRGVPHGVFFKSSPALLHSLHFICIYCM